MTTHTHLVSRRTARSIRNRFRAASPIRSEAPGGTSGIIGIMLMLVLFSNTAAFAQASSEAITAAVIEKENMAASKSAVARLPQLAEEMAAPVYPASGIVHGIEGQVRVGYTVDKKGRARHAVIEEGLGLEFNKEALRVIREARFTPALDSQGNPVSARCVTTFVFKLN